MQVVRVRVKVRVIIALSGGGRVMDSHKVWITVLSIQVGLYAD